MKQKRAEKDKKAHGETVRFSYFYLHKYRKVRIHITMNVSELKRGERAVVIKVELPMLLKERMRSLGVFTGAKFIVLKSSLRKKIFLIQTGSAKVALDSELAEGIMVLKT